MKPANVEGQHAKIEYRWAEKQLDRLPALTTDLVQHRVVVIVAPGLLSTLAAKAANQTVPIIFSVGGDPVQLGLVASLNRPAGNLTGTTAFGPEFGAKGLEVLHLPATVSVGGRSRGRDLRFLIRGAGQRATHQTPSPRKVPHHAICSERGPRIEMLAGNSSVAFPARRRFG